MSSLKLSTSDKDIDYIEPKAVEFTFGRMKRTRLVMIDYFQRINEELDSVWKGKGTICSLC